jgi:chemotaxis protein histidine kinase CheA
MSDTGGSCGSCSCSCKKICMLLLLLAVHVASISTLSVTDLIKSNEPGINERMMLCSSLRRLHRKDVSRRALGGPPRLPDQIIGKPTLPYAYQFGLPREYSLVEYDLTGEGGDVLGVKEISVIDLTREVIDLTRDREVIDVDKSEVENEQQETADKEATRQQQAGQEAAADLFASSKAQSEAAATKTNEADVRAVKEVEEAERATSTERDPRKRRLIADDDDSGEDDEIAFPTSSFIPDPNERVEALRSLLASFRKAKYSEAAATKTKDAEVLAEEEVVEKAERTPTERMEAPIFASSKAQSEAAATKTNEAKVRAEEEAEEAESAAVLGSFRADTFHLRETVVFSYDQSSLFTALTLGLSTLPRTPLGKLMSADDVFEAFNAFEHFIDLVLANGGTKVNDTMTVADCITKALPKLGRRSHGNKRQKPSQKEVVQAYVYMLREGLRVPGELEILLFAVCCKTRVALYEEEGTRVRPWLVFAAKQSKASPGDAIHIAHGNGARYNLLLEVGYHNGYPLSIVKTVGFELNADSRAELWVKKSSEMQQELQDRIDSVSSSLGPLQHCIDNPQAMTECQASSAAAALRRFMERLKKLPLELEAPSTLPSVKPNEQSPRDAIEEIPSLLNRLVTALTGASVEAFSLDATIGLTKACEEVAAALGVLFESGSELSTEGSDLFSAAELKLALALLPEDDVLKCRDTIVALLKHEHGWVFATPVDPVELGLDDYFKIIEVPMDLGTIKTKLDTGGYNSSEEFESDVRLTFENATTYNSEGTVVHDMARELKKYFEDDLKKHPTHQRLVFKLGTK